MNSLAGLSVSPPTTPRPVPVPITEPFGHASWFWIWSALHDGKNCPLRCAPYENFRTTCLSVAACVPLAPENVRLTVRLADEVFDVNGRMTGVMCESTCTVVGGSARAAGVQAMSAIAAQRAVRRMVRPYIAAREVRANIARTGDPTRCRVDMTFGSGLQALAR